MHAKLGDFLIDYRDRHDYSLRQMASVLGVSAAFLSALEVGKKKIPDTFYDRLLEKFIFTKKEKKNLKDAIALSNGSVEIDLCGLNKTEREVSILFARNFKHLSKDTLLQIKELVKDELYD